MMHPTESMACEEIDIFDENTYIVSCLVCESISSPEDVGFGNSSS